MLNGAFGKQHLSFSPVTRQASLDRRTDNVIEHKGSIDKKRETDNLEPFEGLPAESKRDNPNEERAAGVNCATRGSGDSAGDGQTEEVETTGKSIRAGTRI